ncbi:MAG TPA: sigma-70 family RNA polymerase sigma factor [Candidatus Eisenbacteria bacterium]|jgi:RNA polymerase sigma-70 factor (ECF subfamily)|nr:sigma-70 family RNA polymerase sigma factor [Candidatus Eisenbacteria bacterium]
MARVTKIAEADSSAPKLASGAPSTAAAEERRLVRRAQKGEKGAFEILVQRHQHRVFAVARGILKRQEDVEDIAQQVFVKAYFSLKRFDQRAAFSTWLYKITVNECWDLLRKRKARPLVYESDFSEEQSRQFSASAREADSGPDTSERMAMRQRLDSMLAQLDDRDRAMLILKEVEGFSVEEIADSLGLNANTVKVRLFRARRRIVEYTRRERREV